MSLVTTSWGPENLSAHLPPELAFAGEHHVTVTNPAPFGGTTAALAF